METQGRVSLKIRIPGIEHVWFLEGKLKVVLHKAPGAYANE